MGAPTSAVDFETSVLGSTLSQLVLPASTWPLKKNHTPQKLGSICFSLATKKPDSSRPAFFLFCLGLFFISDLDFGSGCCRVGFPEQSRNHLLGAPPKGANDPRS